MNERRARWGFYLVLAAAAAVLSVCGGSVPLMDPDEARFARTSVEMARSGDLVVPTYEGSPRLVKPPLLHWLQSALFRTFGVSERVARLPSAAATVLTLYLAGWIARRRFGHEGAFWAAAILATMPLVLVVGRLGTLDALLALHVLAVVALDIAEPKETRGHRALAIGLLSGLAFLIKGPIGLLLPLLLLLVGRTASARPIVPGWNALSLATAGWCAVVLPWGLAFVVRVGWDAVAATVRREFLERYFEGHDHIHPPWFYLPVLAVALAPWVAPVVVALVRVVLRRDDPATRTAMYAGAGLLTGLIFFSLGQSKLPNYLLPLLPLAAVLATWELGQELDAPRERTLGPLLLWMTLGAIATGLGLGSAMGLEATPRAVALAGAAIYALAALVGLFGVVARRPRWVFGAAAAGSALFLFTTVTFLLPDIARTRTSAYLVREVPELAQDDRPLWIVDMKLPSLTFYLDRVPEEIDLADFERRLEGPEDPLIVLDEADLPRATQNSLKRLQRVGEQGKFEVFEKKRDRAGS